MSTENTPCAGCGKPKPAVLLLDGLCQFCRFVEADDARRDHKELPAKIAESLNNPSRPPVQKPKSEFIVARQQLRRGTGPLAERLQHAAAAPRSAAPDPGPLTLAPGADIRSDPLDGSTPASAEAARQELARRELARRRFLPFVQRFDPDYMAGWLHVDIAAHLEQFMQDVADKKSPRLMIWVPPRHGKSQLTSKRYPAWVLGHYPRWEFMLCSYSGSLANRFSRDVRSIMRDPAYHAVFPTRLDPDTQSVELWQTVEGGGLLAAGVGGPITGSGAHILLIDDPVKNREEAESPQIRQSIKDWYTSTAYTRLAPGGGVLIIQTRWHDDDLSGWLMSQMEDESGDEWKVVVYPAIATEDERFRHKGEALHPDRYPLDALERIRRTVGERDWWALYQQKPVADEGAYFTRDDFRFYWPDDLQKKSDEMVYYAAWDLAIGQAEMNDYSVGLTAGLTRDEDLYVVDHKRGRYDAAQLVDHIIDMHLDHNVQVTGLEHGQIHMTLRPFLEKRIAERRAWKVYYESLKTGKRDKSARARSIQGMARRGKVYLPHPSSCEWVNDFINECLRFPVGTHDDQVDALAWLGLMIEEMAPSVPLPQPKKASWKDKLDQFVTRSDRHRSAMSA